ncbi:uncharacterized protein ACN427_000365 isoform 1-T1 [Glossina fuscipes fuscipes]
MSQSQRVVFEDLRTGQLRNKEETYLRLITGYGITRYTREQLGCQDCLNDLNQEGKDNCEEVSKSTRRSTMPTTSMTQRMEERKIGKRLQATVVVRFAFFREAGSCSSCSIRRIDLLRYVLFTLLTGKNFREPLENTKDPAVIASRKKIVRETQQRQI